MHGAFWTEGHVSKSALEDFGGFRKVPSQNTLGVRDLMTPWSKLKLGFYIVILILYGCIYRHFTKSVYQKLMPFCYRKYVNRLKLNRAVSAKVFILLLRANVVLFSLPCGRLTNLSSYNLSTLAEISYNLYDALFLSYCHRYRRWGSCRG